MNFINHKIKSKRSRKAGFTLIEMLVAVFVFSVIMTIATGAIFSIVSANKTSQALKSVLDNMSSALDSMSRDIRYGGNYFASSEKEFSFEDRNGNPVIYVFDPPNLSSSLLPDEAVFRCDGSISDRTCFRLTAPEVHVRKMSFYVKGEDAGDQSQPRLLMIIDGYAKAGSAQTDFNIETMVNQRNLMCKYDVICS